MSQFTNAVAIEGGKFAELSDGSALFMADEDTLPPTVCPDLLPAGWVVVDGPDNPIDFEFQDGDWREVYILERDE